MYVIKQAGIGMATMSDLKTHAKQTLAATRDARIYVLNDGKPVAGLVSLEHMGMLEELLEDRALARVAMQRQAAIESGEDMLLDEDDFFAAAESHFAQRGVDGAPVPTGATVHSPRSARPAKSAGKKARARAGGAAR